MSSLVLRKDLFEATDDNGYIFCGKFDIPEELLIIILSYLEPKDLVYSCRSVCKTWCNVIDSQVWNLKFRKSLEKSPETPWFAYYLLLKKTLNRNLIKNGCGLEGFKHWKILNDGGNTKWKVEKPPLGCDNFPKDADGEVVTNESCFVTSADLCAKEQIINLYEEGATSEFMDTVRPNIIVSEWVAGRFDTPSYYRLSVTLLDENKAPLIEIIPDQMKKKFRWLGEVGGEFGSSWNKITHVFDDYGPGVRFIKFQHLSRNHTGWDGYYGSKMTGASVILTITSN